MPHPRPGNKTKIAQSKKDKLSAGISAASSEVWKWVTSHNELSAIIEDNDFVGELWASVSQELEDKRGLWEE